MKLGDVKAEALRLMFVTMEDEVNAENIGRYKHESRYAPYLMNMDGSISRGLQRVANERKLGRKMAEITKFEGTGYFVYGRLPEDFLSISGLSRYYNNRFETVKDYKIYGNRKVSVPKRDGVKYFVEYHPNAPKLPTDDTQELDVPTEVAMMIPYFVKGELYEEEDANAAVLARNLFEQWLREYSTDAENYAVETVYTMGI
ncbi:MAG: hypothetical protein IJ981_03140 [Clostridia bacterium]|nr:hypothetical protein [Clostridia bacterium]